MMVGITARSKLELKFRKLCRRRIMSALGENETMSFGMEGNSCAELHYELHYEHRVLAGLGLGLGQMQSKRSPLSSSYFIA